MFNPKYSIYLIKYKEIIEKFTKLTPENQEKVIEEGIKIVNEYYNKEKNQKKINKKI